MQDTRPKIHSFNVSPYNQRCPIQSRLQSVLGVRSLYVERNEYFLVEDTGIFRKRKSEFSRQDFSSSKVIRSTPVGRTRISFLVSLTEKDIYHVSISFLRQKKLVVLCWWDVCKLGLSQTMAYQMFLFFSYDKDH